jgi:hypothetical protein
MRLGDLLSEREFSVDQDSSMSVEPAPRTVAWVRGVSAPAETSVRARPGSRDSRWIVSILVSIAVSH